MAQSLKDFADCDVIGQWEDGCEYTFPFLDVSPMVEEGLGLENSLFSSVHLCSFEELDKKQTYILCVKVLHMRSLEEMKTSSWVFFFLAQISQGKAVGDLCTNSQLINGQEISSGE